MRVKTSRRRLLRLCHQHRQLSGTGRATLHCAIIDSVLDYDPKSGHTATTSADRLIARVSELNAQVEWILETHVHADHLTAAPYLKEKLGGKIRHRQPDFDGTKGLRHAVQCR